MAGVAAEEQDAAERTVDILAQKQKTKAVRDILAQKSVSQPCINEIAYSV